MKRSLIALGIAATVALPLTAQAAPKVYGKLHLSAEQFEKEYENPATMAEEYVRLQSNDSRFGVKGEDELTASISAVYMLEWGIDADADTSVTTGVSSTTINIDGAAVAPDASANTAVVNKVSSTSTNIERITQRNRFVGLKHGDFGTLKLGKYDTYLKLAQGKTDLFNDMTNDMKYVIAGENRVNNVIGYESPKFLDGLVVSVMTQTQENQAGTAKESKNGNSASIVYDNSDIGLYVALAMDNNVNSATALNGTRESDNMRAVIAYKIADLSLSALYNTSEAAVGTVGNEETGMTVGLAYKLGDQTLKAQWGVAEHDVATAATQEKTMWSVGVDHNFNSKTRGYAFYTAKEEDKLAVLTDTEESVFGVGLEHNF